MEWTPEPTKGLKIGGIMQQDTKLQCLPQPSKNISGYRSIGAQRLHLNGVIAVTSVMRMNLY